MSSLLDKRFVVVAGKGGVGRTTLSMIVGLWAAARGKRTLVCFVNSPLRYAELLGGVAIGDELHQVFDGLEVINLNPVAAREEYGLQVLKSPTVHRLVFGSKMVGAFLDAVPGLSQWAMLGKASFHALNSVGGEPEYDMVVFDTPATGHGLEMLALPSAIVDSVPASRIREEAQERVDLLMDPLRCEILPVTIPEETPVNEAGELVEALRGRGFPVERIVVNMVHDAADLEELEGILEDPPGGDPDWLLPARVEAARLALQRDCLERISETTGFSPLEIPHVPEGIDDATLPHLARVFDPMV